MKKFFVLIVIVLTVFSSYAVKIVMGGGSTIIAAPNGIVITGKRYYTHPTGDIFCYGTTGVCATLRSGMDNKIEIEIDGEKVLDPFVEVFDQDNKLIMQIKP